MTMLAGEGHQQHDGRRPSTAGKEAGCCDVDGQKVPIRRPRLRASDKLELRLGSYELFQHSGPTQVWGKIMRGFRLATTAPWCGIFRMPMASTNQR